MQRNQVDKKINYIRNSVKATVDAYDGTVNLYQFGPRDPVLETWMKAFPGTVKPQSELPSALVDHLRYPEDLFKVQRDILSRYHVTKATTFYGGSENWKVPEDPTSDSTDAKQPPYYLTIKLPSDVAESTDQPDAPEFSLTSVYEPNARQNLASFMAVNADAQSSKETGSWQTLEVISPAR